VACAARGGRSAGELCCVAAQLARGLPVLAGWAEAASAVPNEAACGDARCARLADPLQGLLIRCWRSGLSVGAGRFIAGSARGLAAAAALQEGLHGCLPCALPTALLIRGAA